MRDAGFHSHRAAKKGDGLAPSQSIVPHVPTGFEDRILLKLTNRGRGVLGLLRSALTDPGMSGVARMRHSKIAAGLPLSGVIRTLSRHRRMTESDPTRSLVSQICCAAQHRFRSMIW